MKKHIACGGTRLRALRLGVAFVSVATLAGCALVPGSRMPYSEWYQDYRPGHSGQQEEALSDAVRVQPITAALLLQERDNETEASTPSDQDEAAHTYLIGVGDILQVTVWDHPELTIPAGSQRSAAESGNVVHGDGTIYYPYVGKLEVVGKDVGTVREEITRRLRRYIENPQVDVMVAAFNSQHVYVTGAVNKPGMVPISNIPLRVIDAIGSAGGLSDAANWRDVVLVRHKSRRPMSLRAIYQDGNLGENLLLQDGDVIHVGRNDDNKVFVLGEVLNPQPLVIGRNGMSLAEALAGAGGIDQMQADASGIFVMRRAAPDSGASIDVYQLDGKNATALVLADHFELQPRDVVYVTHAPIAAWNRVIQQLVPTLNALYLGSRGYREVRN